MNEELQTMIFQAQEKLRAARVLLDCGSWGDAASRAYYAAFHAVSAVHLSEGESYSTHSRVIGMFNRKFVTFGSDLHYPFLEICKGAGVADESAGSKEQAP